MMGLRGVAGVAVAVMAAMVPAGAQGQVAWDSPLLLSPASPAGAGVFLMEGAPSSGLGVLGTWRDSAGPGVGFRLGLVDDAGSGLAVVGGVDYSQLFYRHSDDFPIDVLWGGGVGVGIGDYAIVSIPVGVTFGRTLDAENVLFTPYVTPRLYLDAFLGDGRGRRERRDSLDLGLAVDLGADVAFSPSIALRFAATIGDRQALAVGLAFPVF